MVSAVRERSRVTFTGSTNSCSGTSKFGTCRLEHCRIRLVGQLADGIFSTATFSDELVSIDYPRSRIEFNVSDDGVRADHIPAWFFSNLVLLPLEINDVHEGLFLLDTGAVTTVLSHNMAGKLGVHEDTPGARIGGGIAGIAGAGGTVLLVPDVTL